MSGTTGILRRRIRHLAVASLFAVLCSGCQHNANPPSEEWLRENFEAHKSEFDEIVDIALSVPFDGYAVYPGYIYCDSIIRNESGSIYFDALGEAKRARLDSLLQAVKCIDMSVSSANRDISLTCYIYGSIRGWSVDYVYLSERPLAMDFVEDKDIYDAFLYWQGDKSKRPFPKKELDKHWHIMYLQ